MRTETIILNKERNVSLTVYLQEVGGEFRGVGERPAVLVIPGGGYAMCSDREADPVTFPYLKAGYHAFILRYSLKEQAIWPNPLADYEQAMALIRGKAGEWHVAADRIAVIGFSAGGHLAACAATMAENRPNAAILGYPVITGATARSYQPSAPDAAEAVDAKTCPCFVFATRTDDLVPVGNSLRFLTALEQNEIAFESHIYANGPHGLSTGDSSIDGRSFSSRYPRWVEDSISWLREVLGGFGPDGPTEALFPPRINGNREETLSVDCSLEYLLAKPAACELLPMIRQIADSSPVVSAAARAMTLRVCLLFDGCSEEKLSEIDAVLRSIPNTSGRTEPGI